MRGADVNDASQQNEDVSFSQYANVKITNNEWRKPYYT